MNDVTVAVLRRRKRNLRKVESPRNLKADDALALEEEDLRDALKDPLIELALQPSVTEGDPSLPWGDSEPHRRIDHWLAFRDVLASMHDALATEEESRRNQDVDLDQGLQAEAASTDTQAHQNQQTDLAEEETDESPPVDAELDIEIGTEIDEGAPDDHTDDDDDAPQAALETEELLPSPPSLAQAPAPAPPPPVKEGPKVLPEGPQESPSSVAQAYASMRASDRAKQQHTLDAKVMAGAEALTAVTQDAVPTYTAEMTGHEDKPVTGAVPVRAETGAANAAHVTASKASEEAATGLASAPDQRSTARGRGDVHGMVRQAVASEEPTKKGTQKAVQAAHQGKDGINTQVQPPAIVLTGNADPQQAVEGTQLAVDESEEALAKAQQAVMDGPGPEIAQTRTMVEDFTVPDMAVPKMPTFEGEVGGVEEYLSYDLVTPDIEAAFDAEVETRMAASMGEVDKMAAQAQADFDSERDTVLGEAATRVSEANTKAQADQEAATAEARADITGKQQQAMDEQAAAVSAMRADVRKQQASVMADIDARVTADQRRIDADMAKAKSKADAEVKKGEAQAKAREAELEEEDDSWWDDVTDFVGDCIEAVTDAIMDVWDAVAEAVGAIIDAAVEAANALIDATIEWAKQAVDVFIDFACGAVDALLGEAFPELAAQLKAGLETVRDELHEQLDAFGAWLKEQVAAVADFVKAGLEAIGQVLQATLDIIGNIVMAALEGDWAEIGLSILKGVLSLAGISWEDFQEIIAKGAEIITCLLEDPGAVVGNAIDAVGQGFSQFGDNFMDHFVSGAIEWITGTTGITLPETFDIAGVLDVALQILGLSVDTVKDKARDHLGDDAVDTMEKVYEYIEALWTGGFTAVWELLKGDLGSLWDDIIGGITDWITEKLIIRGVQFIASLATGVGAIIEGVIAIYNFVVWLKDNITRIWEVVSTVIDSVHEFVMGNITPAANKIEGALAGLIPVAIDLITTMLNLGGLPKKVRKVVEGVRGKIDKALDKMFEKALDVVGLESKKKGGDDGDNPTDPVTADAIVDPVPFTADGEDHRLWIEKNGTDAVVMMASHPAPVDVTIDKLEAEADKLGTKESKLADDADGEAKVANRVADLFLQNKATADKVEAHLKTLAAQMDHLMTALPDEADAARNLAAIEDIPDRAHWADATRQKASPFQGLAWESAIASASGGNALTQVLSGFAQVGRKAWIEGTKDPIAFVSTACKRFKIRATADGWDKLVKIARDPERDDLTVATLQMAAGSIGLALASDASDPRRTDFEEIVATSLKSVGIAFDEFLGERTLAPEFAVGWGPFALTMKRPKDGSKDYPSETGDLNLFKWDTPAFESPNFFDAVGALKDISLLGAPVKFSAKLSALKIGAEFKAQALNDEEVGLNAKFTGDAFAGSMSAAIAADVAPFLTAFELKGELGLKGGAEGEWTPVWNHKDKTLKGAQGKVVGQLKGEGKLSAEVIKLSLLKLLGVGGDSGGSGGGDEADKKSFLDSFLQGNGLFKIDLLKRGVDLAKVTKFFVAEAPGNKITLAGDGDLQVEVHPALKAAFDAAKGLFNKAQSALTKGWEAFKKGGNAALKGIKDAGSAVITKVGEVGKALVDGTKNMLGLNTKDNKNATKLTGQKDDGASDTGKTVLDPKVDAKKVEASAKSDGQRIKETMSGGDLKYHEDRNHGVEVNKETHDKVSKLATSPKARRAAILALPEYKTFRARFGKLVGILGDTYSGANDPEKLWVDMVEASIGNQAWVDLFEKHGKDDQKFYQDPTKGWVKIDSKVYDTVMANLSTVLQALQDATSGQASRAASFGFWSGGAGRHMAETHMEMTLETSGLGALFDGIGSLTGRMNPTRVDTPLGWDHELWGALSKAYAELVNRELLDDGGKQVGVFWSRVPNKNIWTEIESKAVKAGFEDLGALSDFEKQFRYHAVAARPDDDSKPDLRVKGTGDHDGILESSKDESKVKTTLTRHLGEVARYEKSLQNK